MSIEFTERISDIVGEAKILSEILHKTGFEAVVVGGAVRDILMLIYPHDLDIATNATPEQVTKVFTEQGFKVIPVGEKFGTVVVTDDNMKQPIEVTTYRSEGRYTDKRHPDSVKFETSLVKDLERRDFTMNAIALDVDNHLLHDPFHGRIDIENKIIRAVGDPEERFREDPLRMVRMCRFSSLGFVINLETFKAAKKLCYQIQGIPMERIKDELFKILAMDDPIMALNNLDLTDLIMFILPEVGILKNATQPSQYHKYSVMYHMFETTRLLPKDKPLLRFAGLVHDIGKTHMNQHSPYFPNHGKKGLELFDEVSERLKLSNEEDNYVRFMIQHHMDQFGLVKLKNTSGLRRWMSRLGDNIKYLGDLFILFQADVFGTGRDDIKQIMRIKRLKHDCEDILSRKQPIAIKDLAINGYDLMNLGIPSGPIIGKIQQRLLEGVIEDPSRNNRDCLLSVAKQFYEGKLY